MVFKMVTWHPKGLSKAFRVYNLETKRVEENLHVNFLENKPNVVGKGHAWMFDLDYLTNSMTYEPVLVENQANTSAGPKEANNNAGTQVNDDQGANSVEINLHEEHFVLSIWPAYSTTVKSSRDKLEKNTDFKTSESPRKEASHANQNANTNITNLLSAVSTRISTAGPSRALNNGKPSYPDDPSMPHIEDIYANTKEGIFTNSSYDDEGVVTDFNNLETTTRSKVKKNFKAHALILVDLPFGKKAIGTKWVYRNKKDERGVVVRNKARLVAEGHRQEEGIDYDEVFAYVARIEAIRIFLAFASYMGFIVYQIDVKSAFLYGTINKEVYVIQPPGFVDPKFPNKVYKIVKALYGLHIAPRACSTKKSWCVEFEELMKNRFQMSSMGELTFFLGLQTASTPIKTQKPLVKDKEAADVDSVLVLDLGNLQQEVVNFLAGDLFHGNIQNLLLDYGFNIMNTKIYIDNESTICIVKNPVFHSKTKHIEIWHHFIRDAYVKKLIQVLKIHTDDNVADLLTKAFNVSRIFECWSKHHTTNGHQFTMSNPHQELTSLEANSFCKELASPKEMALVQCVSAKRNAWNQFGCSMASAVICLATGRKFNFSKNIFDSMVRNVDSPSKFLMCLGGCIQIRGKIEAIDVDEDITLMDAENQVDMDAELQGRKDDDSVTKEVSAAEPTVFDDEEVTMTMAQTLIKIKAKKERF
nr:hypothetical protein [Tanacetum cinerariifolium]